MAGPLIPTHAVATVVFGVRNGKFLLLKRATPPLIWGPPSGRLEKDEDPRDGARRELMEETGLLADHLHILDYWFGAYKDGYLLSLDFTADLGDGDVVLSDEHEDFCWVSIEDLREGFPPLSTEKNLFPLEAFEFAWEGYLRAHRD